MSSPRVLCCRIRPSWLAAVLLPALIQPAMPALMQPAMPAEIPYTTARSPWPEWLGSQRAVVSIAAPSPAVRITLPWRRHDLNPEARRFLVIHAATGDTVPNVLRLAVSREACDIVAGPVAGSGEYYLYYLPYGVSSGWGYYAKDYLPQEPRPADHWLAGIGGADPSRLAALPSGRVLAIESRTAFDSFFPMEVIPTKAELQAFLTEHDQDYLLFPEDRRFPIRMKDDLPLRWIQRAPASVFSGSAGRNEYYTFQIGVYAAQRDLENLRVTFSALRSSSGAVLPAESMTCFNTGGINGLGQPFTIRLDVARRTVQPLWIGVDVPRNALPGLYKGALTITPANAPPRSIALHLTIADTLAADRGDGEPWRHSRLRWLNSTLGIDSAAVAPYGPIVSRGGGAFGLTGHEVRLAADGLPVSVSSWGEEVLSAPMQLVVETSAGNLLGSEAIRQSERNTGGMVIRTASLRRDALHLEISSSLESDGFSLHTYRLTAGRDIQIRDVRLEIPMRSSVASYMMGMGRMGGTVPERHYAVWEGSHDSFWMGNHRGGLYCELRGASYTGPLLDLFRPGHPRSWWNERKGGFSIRKDSLRTLVRVFSGPRPLAAGQPIEFSFALLVTPVKKLNFPKHFAERYYHGGGLLPSREDIHAGVRVVNLHHANIANPYINYPFLATPVLRRFVDSAHSMGLKLKLYYTIRELTNHVTELWALRSLGHEILADGPGGGFPWLREHVVSGYLPQWYHHFWEPGLGVDASMLSAPGPSRWYNYYIEGLAWLLREVRIDGLYLDDVSYDRQTVKRIRKVMESVRPGCLIDLHSNTFFSKGPATQYTEFFPYVDRLWFGEGFQYNSMPPENWFVEVSGIPFGLTGDMLEGGGNPWRGMVYGMTVRYPWVTDDVTCDPRFIWKVWDEFGIQTSSVAGYWDERPAVRTDHPDVLATAYLKQQRVLVALASWASEPVSVRLQIDWQRLQINPQTAVLRADLIDRFQPSRRFELTDPIPVDPGKGWLLVLENEER